MICKIKKTVKTVFAVWMDFNKTEVNSAVSIYRSDGKLHNTENL